ncbi:hypothetical protein [Sphingomonas sp. Leaf208]|nr:hypothetical protein [Sphingomonas sp. Leaf208]
MIIVLNASATGMAANGGPVAIAQLFKVERSKRNGRRDEAATASDVI